MEARQELARSFVVEVVAMAMAMAMVCPSTMFFFNIWRCQPEPRSVFSQAELSPYPEDLAWSQRSLISHNSEFATRALVVAGLVPRHPLVPRIHVTKNFTRNIARERARGDCPKTCPLYGQQRPTVGGPITGNTLLGTLLGPLSRAPFPKERADGKMIRQTDKT